MNLDLIINLENLIYLNTLVIVLIAVLMRLDIFNSNIEGKKVIVRGGLILMIIDLLIIIYIWSRYNMNYYGYTVLLNLLGVNWGIDGISLVLIALTVLLGVLSIIGNWNNIVKEYSIYYIYNIIILVILMMLNFICLDLINFYVLFEVTLIPLYYIVGIYGAQKKNKAAYYVLIYTLTSSLFMLLSISILYIINNNTDFNIINNKVISGYLQSILYIGMMIGLAVKTPLMPVHTWLPTVHSESPLGGSILLAGVILKLAVYGIIRLLLSNVSEVSLLYTPFIYVISIITIIYSSLITLIQTDLKVIIAYSSISHLAVCILGIFSNNLLGLSGSIILSLAHGLVSPALFLLMGGVLYDRYHNRFLYYYQGLTQYMPIFAIYLTLFSFSNTGTPGSGNFIGEFLSITGSIDRHIIIGSITAASVLLSAAYQMKLTNKILDGSFSIYLKPTSDLQSNEHTVLLILAIGTVLMGILPNYLLEIISLPLSGIIYSISL